MVAVLIVVADLSIACSVRKLAAIFSFGGLNSAAFCGRYPPSKLRYPVAMTKRLAIKTTRQGLHEITAEIASIVENSGLQEGLCTVFIQHTSASLVIQENADPSARRDLESWFNRLVKENDPLFTHTMEGPDDMPSHIKAAMTATSLSIPILDGRLVLGRWQGIYVWEHRHAGAERKIVVHLA
jgi:secondary thiamine-phosphate synthase enzyme